MSLRVRSSRKRKISGASSIISLSDSEQSEIFDASSVDSDPTWTNDKEQHGNDVDSSEQSELEYVPSDNFEGILFCLNLLLLSCHVFELFGLNTGFFFYSFSSIIQ